MSVLGFREAVASAEVVRLPNDVTVRVPSIAASALLKLVAWWERRLSTTRDAVDLGVMVRWYSIGDRFDRLHDAHIEVLVRYDFDAELAGAWMLGRDMSHLLAASAAAVVVRIVNDEDALSRLASETRRPLPRSLVLMRAMREGINEGAVNR